jgi:hypothetical protein
MRKNDTAQNIIPILASYMQIIGTKQQRNKSKATQHDGKEACAYVAEE